MNEDRLIAGARVLEGWGLRVVMGDAVLARQAYLAGPDDARRRDLQRMIDDPGICAILCARGGYGSQRIVPSLDLAALACRPKPIVGYSDTTALLSAVVGTGTMAIHGPMVAADLARGVTGRSAEHLRRLLGDADYRWDVDVPVEVRSGYAEGRLLGGCLSVLVTLLGTPWAPDLDDAILFLEDTHEWPYRLDRLLTQLLQSGRLDRIGGVVFGTMAGCRSLDGVGALDVVRERFADAPFPVAFGLAAGHDPAEYDVENLALPLGVRVALDTARGSLIALEPAVV